MNRIYLKHVISFALFSFSFAKLLVHVGSANFIVDRRYIQFISCELLRNSRTDHIQRDTFFVWRYVTFTKILNPWAMDDLRFTIVLRIRNKLHTKLSMKGLSSGQNECT